jgi:hypothetical protein
MTHKRLAGKTALVTAAGQGIGRAAAELFASEGATVVATDINADSLRHIVGCRTQQLDVRDPAQVAAAILQAGPIDVLFNCAGYVHSGTILDCDESAWCRPAGNARARPWIDHQHVIRCRIDQGSSQPFRLRRNEGCSRRANEVHCGGFCRKRNQMQCDMSRYRRHAVPARAPHSDRGLCRCLDCVYLEATDGSFGTAR